MLHVFDELLWALRRGGLAIAPSQAIDAARAVAEIGFDDRGLLCEALACILVSSTQDRVRLQRGLDRFFSASRPQTNDFWDRLRRQGFTESELDALRGLLELEASHAGEGAIHSIVNNRGEMDRLLAAADIRRLIEPTANPRQAGFYTQRLLERLKFPEARAGIARLRERLSDALGKERADALAGALANEIARAREEIRTRVGELLRQADDEVPGPATRKLAEVPFVSLTETELREVRRAVREFAARLKGAARVRERRGRRGRFDLRRTMRGSLRTAGVPFHPIRRRKHRDKPRLVILCDISDSVRIAATFMLELVYALQELFETTRSFVFVSEIGEVTRLFHRERVHRALALAYGGAVIDTGEASSYGRALSTFESRWRDAVDHRTTLVVLGDGRTNHRPHGAEVLDKLRARTRRIFWLCPEARSMWGIGDSAMPVYASKVSRVFEVRCAADLERAARQLVG